jgi:hypothetical protein
VVLTRIEARIRDRLLNVSSLDKGKVLLDLLKSPPVTDQTQEMPHGETMAADARLAAHHARLDREAIKDSHDTQHTAEEVDLLAHVDAARPSGFCRQEMAERGLFALETSD